MAGVTSGGIYFNTDSGLTPFLDRLTATLDRDSQQQQQYAGIAPALRATGVPIAQPSGGILASLLPGLFAQPQQPAPASPSAAPASAAPAPRPTIGPPAPGFDSAVRRTLSFEGGLNPGDTNGTPSNYGINQAAHPDIDVTKLTPDQAKAIYKSDYWDSIGGDNMSPALSRAAFDTAVIAGPGKAKELLAASGGDAMKFMDLREHFQSSLLNNDPQKYGKYAAAWSNRNQGLRLDIAALNGRANATPGDGTAPATTAYSPQGAGGGQPPQMPIATSEPHVTPTAQPNAAGTRAPLGGITNEALGAMIANPASRELGLKLWQQRLTGKDFGFSVTPDGTVIRTDKESGTAVPVFQAPVKRGFQEFNGRLLSTDPQSGTARDATPAGLPQGYRPATAQERTSYGVGPTTPLFMGPDGKPMTLQGGTNVTVNNAVDPILKGLGDQFVSSADAARNAADTVRSIQTARSQLNGGMFTGTGANQVLALQKAGQLIGVGDPSKIQNTETFRAAVGPIVLGLVKNLGSGSGITDADREFAEKMAGGNIALDQGSIGRILDIQEKAARSRIDRHNALADEMLKTRPELATSAPMLHITPPPASASAGAAATTRQVGGQTYVKGPDGNWYTQ